MYVYQMTPYISSREKADEKPFIGEMMFKFGKSDQTNEPDAYRNTFRAYGEGN